MSDDIDIAVAYSSIHVWGGAEHVMAELARTFDAPVYCMRADRSLVPDDIEVIELMGDRQAAVAGHLPLLPRRIIRLPMWQTASELHDFDVVIVSKAGPMWYNPCEDQGVVAYVHSPPRNLNDRFAKTASTESVRGWISASARSGFKTLFRTNMLSPDVWIANSDLVQRRLNTAWNVSPDDSRVVYPPTDFSAFDPDSRPTGDYYLSVCRLHDHKHVDNIIETFNNLDQSLVVAGDGPERDRLEALADDHVKMHGFVPDDELRELYAGAKGVVMAAENEDFGMVPVEAMAAGTPVLNVRDGFSKFQVVEGKNGYTWERGNLASAVRKLEENGVEWSSDTIALFAAGHWSRDQFQAGMRRAVRDAYEQAQIEPWADVEEEDLQTAVRVMPDGGENA